MEAGVIIGVSGSPVTVANTLFTGDCGIWNFFNLSQPVNLLNCTVGGNITSNMFVEPGIPQLNLTNVIATSFVDLPNSVGDGGFTTLSHCISADGSATSYSGSNNLTGVSFASLFVNHAASDYRLKNGSLAIDAGIDSGLATDIVGTERPQDAAFDIGAYEYLPLPPEPETSFPVIPAFGRRNRFAMPGRPAP